LPREKKKGRHILNKLQQPLLALCEQIHKPFVQRLITLLVSGLIALLLGGALLLVGHGASFINLTQWPLSATMSIAGNHMSVW
jgi:hypothetical protein